MNIISHRGYWVNQCEMNTDVAFNRAMVNGYGIETDVRDYNGDIVVSHDIPSGNPQTLDDFLHIYNIIFKNQPKKPYLAINIKSTGLGKGLSNILDRHNITNYFVFDMSIPDTIDCLSLDLAVYMRVSEYEDIPRLPYNISGIWLDQFNGDWYTDELIVDLLNKWDKVCIVSPELHKRDYVYCWGMIKNIIQMYGDRIMICTDFPDIAMEYFCEK